MIAVYVVAGLVLLTGLATLVSYNRFVRQRTLVQESWRQVDVELTRRHDLVPNLVATVEGYAAHERQVLGQVTSARAAAEAATAQSRTELGRQESALAGALGQLLALAESYPDLKASSSFLALQGQLAETEDRIAAARRFYNGNVRDYNTRLQTLPSSLVGRLGGFASAEYFQSEAGAAAPPRIG